MDKRKNGFAAVIAAVFTVVMPAGVVAQEDGAHELEEVVVTARRREESLQEVPIAITAFTAADIEMRSIENVEDMQVLLPNVDIRGDGTSGGNSGNMTIRGIPGVARYIDGVHLSGDMGSLENVVELERIEVLRGPQGTYFGKNAIGGAIQYVTKKPQEEFGARIKVTAGEYNRQDIVANVDIPLSDTVLTAVTAARLSRDGHVDSVTINESYGETDNTILRGVLQWQPTDSFQATFTAQYNKLEGNLQGNVLFDVVEGLGFGPRTPERYNEAGIPFNDELYAYGKREQYLNAADYTGPGVLFDSTSFSAKLNWDIRDSVTFKSITASRKFDYASYRDLDATQLVMQNTWYYRESEEMTQEFQLLGSGERFSWVVGIYYFDREVFEKFNGWQRWELTGAGPRGPLARNALDRVVNTDTAIYGEFTYDFNEQLALTVGGRFSNEEYRSQTFVPSDPLGAPTEPSFSLAGTIQVVDGVPLVFDQDFDAFTPRVALQYQFTDSVMAYISYAEGFNGGGVNSRFDPTLPNNGIIPYDSELLKNIELGLRSDLLDNRLRLNLTYFTGDWEDIQIGENLTPGQSTTTNGGAAEIEGFEIEGVWRATENFAMNFTAGWLDAKYTDLGLAQNITVGTPFANAPEKSYSIGGQWDNELNNGGSITTRFDYGWIDDFQTHQDARFQASVGANDAYGLLSARVVYTPPEGNWDIAIHGTNLTEEFYRMGGFAAVLGGVDQGVVGRPREIGVTLGLQF
ncbi:MAG: iron complex outermembrane receptor protein [Candidatus Krumholzibacteriia bacterium]|jgi:iron complex outermembrane receptor protein